MNDPDGIIPVYDFVDSLDGYTPMGPCIVTSEEMGNPHDLDIACYVNDEKSKVQ
jgi:2-keto-4-pentenoate hydratase/2-oxohepta-3-ene-1,7-dioic acid hydratase (catechol pathway)